MNYFNDEKQTVINDKSLLVSNGLSSRLETDLWEQLDQDQQLDQTLGISDQLATRNVLKIKENVDLLHKLSNNENEDENKLSSVVTWMDKKVDFVVEV